MDIQDFQETLAQIPQQEKRAFVLHEVLGFKYKEIAKILNIKTNSVGVYIHRAREIYFSDDPDSSSCCFLNTLTNQFFIFRIKMRLFSNGLGFNIL